MAINSRVISQSCSQQRIDDILTPNSGSRNLKFEVPCLALAIFSLLTTINTAQHP